MMTFFKRLACGFKGHHFYHWRNIYGDEAMYGSRSVWRCVKCGKFQYRPDLHAPVAAAPAQEKKQ